MEELKRLTRQLVTFISINDVMPGGLDSVEVMKTIPRIFKAQQILNALQGLIVAMEKVDNVFENNLGVVLFNGEVESAIADLAEWIINTYD